MNVIVVTRHPGLVTYLREHGLAPADCEVVEHATAELVRGKHVIGVLPLWLAAEAETVTEIPMSIPPEMRGVELSPEQTAEYAGEARCYRVKVLTGCFNCGCPKEAHHLVNYSDGSNVGAPALICPTGVGSFYQ